jgi:hypothetical protein
VTNAGWSTCLDSFADHLAHQRAVLEAGTPELVSEFVPAPRPGALPPALVPRALALQSEADALTERIAEQLSRTRAAIARLQRPESPARPSYIDSRC